METKNNTGLIVVVTLLTVTVLGLIGFIVYDKVLREDNAVNGGNNNIQQGENNNSNTNNGDNSSNENSKYSYKLVDATSAELLKIDANKDLWDDNLLGSFGWTGGEIELINNRTFKVFIDKSNIITLNSNIVSWTGTSTDESWAVALVMDNGEVYMCDTTCLKNAKSEKDMKLLLVDETVLNIKDVDYELFVKTTNGIKKIVYAK